MLSAIALTCLLVLGSLGLPSDITSANSVSQEPIEDPTKEWTITFNTPVANELQNLQKIYVKSTDNLKHEVSIQLSADSEKVTVKPKIPYHFGKTYELVIPKDFQSNTGKNLNNNVTKQFQVQGKVISDITAVYTTLFTNIIVKGSSELTKVTYSFNGSQEQPLIRNSSHFSRGQQGLAKGDLLTIRAYNSRDSLLETQYYEVK